LQETHADTNLKSKKVMLGNVRTAMSLIPVCLFFLNIQCI